MSSRHFPGTSASIASVSPPMRVRMSRKVGWLIAAVMRRTCRFLPSMSSSASQQSDTFFRNRTGGSRGGKSGAGSNLRTRHGKVWCPPIATPRASRESAASSGTRSTSAQYSRTCVWRGSSSRVLSPGSSLSSSKPPSQHQVGRADIRPSASRLLPASATPSRARG